MKILPGIIFFLLTLNSFGQSKQPEDYGFRHLQTIFKGDTIDVLIKSKKGEELTKEEILTK